MKKTIKTIVTLLTTALIMSMPICASAKEKNNLKAKITDETYQNEENPDMYLNVEWTDEGRNFILFTMKGGKGKATNIIKDSVVWDDNSFEYKGKYARVMDYDEAGTELSVEWLDKKAKAYEGIYKNKNVDTAFTTSDIQYTEVSDLKSYCRKKANIGNYISFKGSYYSDYCGYGSIVYTNYSTLGVVVYGTSEDMLFSNDEVIVSGEFTGFDNNGNVVIENAIVKLYE